MTDQIWLWVGFNVFVLAMLALDLGVFHRKAHVVSLKESLVWTFVWIGLALVFNVGVWHYAGSTKALEFFTGYLIEKSLSVDNVFVFALLFSYFAVPPRVSAQGAVLGHPRRAGHARHHYRGRRGAHRQVRVDHLRVRRLPDPHRHQDDREARGGDSSRAQPGGAVVQALMPVTPDYRGDKFFVRENGIRMATPLFVVLLLVEISDLIFAVDSIPAIFAVTKDPFIVYTSNVFAILGLRSLYFALAGVMDKFHYLKIGLGVVLTFVGVKMILAHTAWKIDTLVSLGVIVLILTTSVVMSLLRPKQAKHVVPNPGPGVLKAKP